MWTGLALFAVMAIPDMLMNFDFSSRRMGTAGALFMLFVQVIPLTFLWVAYWIFTSRHPEPLEIIGAIASMAIITAAVGLPIGHEMFHRSEPVSRILVLYLPTCFCSITSSWNITKVIMWKPHPLWMWIPRIVVNRFITLFRDFLFMCTQTALRRRPAV